MPLETGTYIEDLVTTNPAGTDQRRQGDDHLRLVKSVLQGTFPDLDNAQFGAVTATAEDLNKTSDLTNYFPSGGIIIWSGLIDDIPAGWVLCNGSNGTPNLRNRFIIGADADAGGLDDVGDTGGSRDSASRTSGLTAITVDQMPAHTHTVGISASGNFDRDQSASGMQPGGSTSTAAKGSNQGHSHSIPSVTNGNLPSYYALAYIMKS